MILCAAFLNFSFGTNGYLYIATLDDSAFVQAALIVETSVSLDEPLAGFSPTTIEELHSLGYPTPTEAKANADVTDPPGGERFGSFIDTLRGPLQGAIDRGEQIGKIVVCGGWTRSVSTDTIIMVMGRTLRNNVEVAVRPWVKMHVPQLPYHYVICTANFCYPLDESYKWTQLSRHKWSPPYDSTNSGCQIRF